MEDQNTLLEHMDQIHTTEMGAERIRRNLKLGAIDVVAYCKEKIMKEMCNRYRQGKNWYCEADHVKITINVYRYTIITAHVMQ